MSATTDDPWADLYTELEVENAAKAATPPPLPVEAIDDESDDDDGPDEGEAEVGAEGDDGEAPPADGEQPRKRRRRRRRRKGAKPAAGDVLPADGEGVAMDGDDLPPDEVIEDEGEPVAVGAEPADASRDVIRGWNVPSWSEIVAGLYRPDRG